MKNPLFWRFMLIPAIVIAGLALVAGIAFMKFPDNVIVIAFAVALFCGSVFFVMRKEKKARFEAYYSTVQEFGMPVSFGDTDAAFERDGTRFDIAFPKDKYSFFFKINFYLPGIKEKFSVQNRTLATHYDDDCTALQPGESPLPDEFILQSRNREFLLDLLKRRAILNEIRNYDASFFGRFLISLDEGYFELIWSPPVSQQIDGLYQACQTAVVFHDELKKPAQVVSSQA